ncbi:polyketide cyclase [Streptomyces capillispiralis]|uniref:Polyketide cyclase/dehydrase/lipid transport protein n=1 Tax=Streptomyces capillispiralis TaxID=68182 RepID=A0A561TPX5_9ACTN|nr:hypothetical protein FHX78_116211 [Streptomyces capillispiralis]GHH93439.1 polyketide cyclase [Streptomyces capillispiralis]
MAHRPRPVGHGFVRTAPVRPALGRGIPAAPEPVFRAPDEDVTGWTQWFRAVTPARPLDAGAGRGIRLRGGARFRGTILVTRAPEVCAHRVDVTHAPGARALVEEWRLAPAGTGARARWTCAADGTVPSASRSGPPGRGRGGRSATR